MLRTQWKPALEVGVDEMDSDHRALIDLLGRIQDACETDDTAEALAVLEELGAYTEWHFAREEALMRIHAYEFTKEHEQEHRKLTAEVARYLDLLQHNAVKPRDIARFMRRWLLNHIAGSDKHLGRSIVRSREINSVA